MEFDGQTRTLPLILKCCLDALRDDEAIFKSKTLFRNSPDSLPSVSKAEDDWQSPNQTVNMLKYDSDTAAGLLLRWLNSLPEPLISITRQSKFDAALAKYGAEHSKLIKKFGMIVKSMHTGNCNSLYYLCIYLREVLAHSSQNGLTAESLAALFAFPLTHSSPSSNAAASSNAGDAASSDVEASSTMTASESAAAEKTQHAEKIIALLLKEFTSIFENLTIEDTETIPEEQLADEARDAKAKRKHMIRSNSGSIEKPIVRSDSPYRKTMMFSSSADNLAMSPPASPALTPAASANSVDSPKSPTKVRPGPSTINEEVEEKEKEKKGFKSTLRKLGLVGGKKDKDKSPSRSRSGSVSTSSPTPAARNAAAHSPVPSSPKNTEPLSPNAVFGKPYENLLNVANGDDRILPFILVDCLEYLKEESRAKEFGVFRESGSFNDKSRFKKAYDAPEVRMDFDGCDGYTVAALAKDWLRDLPECLLTDALYCDFKSAVSGEDTEQDEVAERLHTAVAAMPETRRTGLNYLIHFFKMHIVAHKEDNKMGESNVGIVIGPCLHRKEDASPEELMDPCHNLIVTTLLLRYETIFRDWDVPKPLADPPGTIYKKANDLDKAASVLDDINRKMAQDDSASERSISPAPERTASPSKRDEERKEKTKRKGSGIWERIKEEATGGRRRSATTQSEVAPFQQEAPVRKITRTASTKSNEPANNSPPASPLPSPNPSVASLPIADAVSPPTSPLPVGESPKQSPRESRKKSSSSSLTVITRPLPPVSETTDDLTASASSGAAPASPTTPASPTAAIEAPIFTRRRSKKTNRVRELSTGSSSSEYPPPVQILTAAQVELWLAENGFADLVNQLRGNTGKQMFSFTRADLKEEFGLRGVALYNLIHPSNENGDGETTPNSSTVTISILSTQISLLTTKVEELLAKIGGTSPRSAGATSTSNSSPSYVISDAAVSAALYPEKTSSRSSPSTSPRDAPSGPATPQPVDMFGVAPPVPLEPMPVVLETPKTPEPVETPSSPSTPSTDDSDAAAHHTRYPTHEAPPVPATHGEAPAEAEKTEKPAEKSVDPPALPIAETVSKAEKDEKDHITPQIGVIEATPRSSRMELYDDASSSSSNDSRS